MSGPTLGIMPARFIKTQLAVYGKADFGGIVIFLTVVFPPSDGA